MTKTDANGIGRTNWHQHVVRAGSHCPHLDSEPDPEEHREKIEPWLSALFQAEHLNVLVGSGLTTAIAQTAGTPVVDMSPVTFQCRYADTVTHAAQESAKRLGRKKPNIEDQARSAIELIGGLRILSGSPAPTLVEVQNIPQKFRPHSPDPAFWDVWTAKQSRSIDWLDIARIWQGGDSPGTPE